LRQFRKDFFLRPVEFDEKKEAERHLSGDEKGQYKLDFSPSKEHPVLTKKVAYCIDTVYEHKQKLIGIIGDLNCQLDIIKKHGGNPSFCFSGKTGSLLLSSITYELKV